jgi:uncharacterized membrane protein (DUF485 family)
MSDHPSHLRHSAEYKTLIKERSKSKWSLLALMLIVYYGFILMIAFDPTLLGTKVGDSHTSYGIIAGLSVMFFSFFIMCLYVRKANKVFDPLTKKLRENAISSGMGAE